MEHRTATLAAIVAGIALLASCSSEPSDADVSPRAWVLPDSNIAIFEDHQSPDVDEVEHIVANATVRW